MSKSAGEFLMLRDGLGYWPFIVHDLPALIRAMPFTESRKCLVWARSDLAASGEALRLLGLEGRRAEWIQVGSLVAASQGNNFGYPSPADVSALRTLVAFDPAPSNLKVYVSRAGHKRRTKTETEIEWHAARMGFDVISPGQLTLSEQIRIFGQARIVVGPHGAGLANVAFAAPGAKVIEFLPRSHALRYVEALSAACHHHYRAVWHSDRSAHDQILALEQALRENEDST